MIDLQTIGQEYHAGFSVKIYYTDNLELYETDDKNLYQILYIDEGSVVIGDSVSEKTLIAPVLLCLNYKYPQKSVHISNGKGFSIFFRPEAINHGLIGNENTPYEEAPADYLETEELLIFPFKESNQTNPVNLPVNGAVRERLLRMATDINTQFNHQPDSYWPCRGRSFLIEMLMLLQSMYKLQIDNSIDMNTTNEAIKPIIRKIHLNYSDPLFTISKEVSKELFGKGFKKLFLINTFKRITRDYPVKYLLKLRISVGSNLLKNTMLSVAEISRRCGYTDENKFTTDFTNNMKFAPLAWRAKFPNPYG